VTKGASTLEAEFAGMTYFHMLLRIRESITLGLKEAEINFHKRQGRVFQAIFGNNANCFTAK